jgi:myo-inositol-1-phosphate synthase
MGFNHTIKPADGKLGILTPGMGAVATTFVAGVLTIKKGLAKPFGSLTQMQTIRIGKAKDRTFPLIKDYVPLAGLEDLEFGGWDIFKDNMYEAAKKAGVLRDEDLKPIQAELSAITPMPAVFSNDYVKNISGENIKQGSLWEKALALIEDIRRFKQEKACSRLVMIWCGSTEIYKEPTDVHQSMEAFEAGLKANSAEISPCQWCA